MVLVKESIIAWFFKIQMYILSQDFFFLIWQSVIDCLPISVFVFFYIYKRSSILRQAANYLAKGCIFCTLLCSYGWPMRNKLKLFERMWMESFLRYMACILSFHPFSKLLTEIHILCLELNYSYFIPESTLGVKAS